MDTQRRVEAVACHVEGESERGERSDRMHRCSIPIDESTMWTDVGIAGEAHVALDGLPLRRGSRDDSRRSQSDREEEPPAGIRTVAEFADDTSRGYSRHRVYVERTATGDVLSVFRYQTLTVGEGRGGDVTDVRSDQFSAGYIGEHPVLDAR
ncbi:hypothetical protein MML48_1g21129 [Holotrichia oblita]|uniref:Uncharacterized protein n=1 Tax=Holotrichia oblita TaxID=644536 RepID=A0ACB9TYG1_HOLOL|nr:hypothetical protein MML48_1g21129 [Holotrichia oblita]